jgi:protein O-GlcNAc transferase
LRVVAAMTAGTVDPLAEALARHERGDLTGAEEIYRAVLTRDPGRAEALQYLGVLLAQTGRAEAGLELMARAVAAAPSDTGALFNLAHGLAAVGRVDEAIVRLRQAVTVDPALLAGWMQLGVLLDGARRFAEAAECFTRASELAPHDPAARYNLARARQAAGLLEAAAADYRAVLVLDPAYVDALNNLGIVLAELGDNAGAIDVYRRALALRPAAIGTRINLGTALRRGGRLDEAIDTFREALKLAPHSAEAEFGLGTALSDQRDTVSAIECFTRVLARNPDHHGALVGLGLGLLVEWRIAEAGEALRRAIKLDPGYAPAHGHMAHVHFWTTADIDAAIECCRHALALDPDLPAVRSNLLFFSHYKPDLPISELYARHREFETNHGAPLVGAWQPLYNSRDPDRRLRIGYVSPDFRDHSCAYFLEPLLASHDSDAVDVFCYAQVGKPDAVTDRLRALAHTWRDTRGMSDAEMAELIRRDRIDILVDLAGHTAGNRMTLFVLKPAPVQATWLGYPGTTGLSAIDYRLTDAIADPPGPGDALSSETPARLESGFHCYRPSPEAPEVGPLPAPIEGRITLGCFHNLAKVNEQVIAAWAAVLTALPGARLAIKDGRLVDRDFGAAMVQKFIALGVAQERIVFLPPMRSARQYLSLFGGVDIALDTFPYNGVTTTCEALWMGVPVVTLSGDRHSARVGASLLAQINHREWVAQDVPSYVKIVTKLASDVAELSRLRAGLRAEVAASSLCNAQGFARAIEAAYRAMWREWCARRPAALH